MKFSGQVVCVCAILAINAAALNASEKLNWPRIYLFGDSITQISFSEQGGWATLLADKFQRKCDVVARGFSGYTTRMSKYALPRVFDRNDATSTVAFVIWLGANDAAPDHAGRQLVPLGEYVDNLDGMLSYLQECGIKRESIILITPPAFDEVKHQISHRGSRRRSKLAEQYAEACASLGTRRNVTVVDIHSEMLKHEDWRDMLSDGLHLAKPGSQLVASLLLPKLQELTSDIPMFLPESKHLYVPNPESLLLGWSANKKE
ncbi:isoamyl acetate-hydrolyzing esterase 1 homolog [Ornithodoros turicata]|uniref:isoamyl acetate-hydrolyzing esterase 1 homolog n=1 Tax=Ornithodoros turicata TaxID=34597 RepID=UPI0031395F67